MNPTLKTFARFAASVLAASALAALTMGCGAGDSGDGSEDLDVTEEVGTAADALSTFTIKAWPSAYPVHAGVGFTNGIVQVSNSTNMQFSVLVDPDGNVTVKDFKYMGTNANTPLQSFPATNNGSQLRNFIALSGNVYNIEVKVSWTLPTVTIQISGSVPGGTITAASTTLCTDA